MSEIKSIADLVPDDRNANAGTPRGRGLVETSLQKYGAGRSILVDRNGKVIAGNKTSEAAAAIGMEGVVVVQTTGNQLVVVQRTDLDLNEDTAARELSIADNRAGELGLSWDLEVLTDLGNEIDLSTFWTKDEIAALLIQETPESGGGDEVPDVQDGPTRVQPGEVWQLGRHRLLCGDSYLRSDIDRLMDGTSADIMHADAPYGIDLLSKRGKLGKSKEYSPVEGDDKPFDPESFLSLAPVSLFWGANHFAHRLPPSPFWLVWDKQGGAKDTTFATCELAWCSDKQPARVLTHVWDGFRRDSEKGVERDHPTQKPIAVIEWVLQWVDGDLVLDPFLGSGTTIIAAERTGRRCYGIEISPQYCDVIIKRWEAETGLTAERIEP